MVLFVILSTAQPALAHNIKDWLRAFCERHLIADDPYQYEHLHTDRLVDLYRLEGGRLYWARDNAWYLKTLGDELRRRPSDQSVIDALADYSWLEK